MKTIENFGAFFCKHFWACGASLLAFLLLILYLTSGKYVILSSKDWECQIPATQGIEAVCVNYMVRRKI